MTDPDQMRELAAEDPYSARDWIEDAQEALRAAANQLEAVQHIANAYRRDAETAACIVSVRLDAILTADTASQENRDE